MEQESDSLCDMLAKASIDTPTKIWQKIQSCKDPRVRFLRNITVLQWLCGDLSFLPPIEKKNKTNDIKKYKVLEDEWGRDILRQMRPDLTPEKQWTGPFGQHLCEEIYILLGKKCTKPLKKEGHDPDHEVDDAIVEVKTQTYYTRGTAGEKIMGARSKYKKIPRLYGKPLVIVCLGGAEKLCREKYGVLGPITSPEEKDEREYYRIKKIELIGATDLLNSI